MLPTAPCHQRCVPLSTFPTHHHQHRHPFLTHGSRPPVPHSPPPDAPWGGWTPIDNPYLCRQGFSLSHVPHLSPLQGEAGSPTPLCPGHVLAEGTSLHPHSCPHGCGIPVPTLPSPSITLRLEVGAAPWCIRTSILTAPVALRPPCKAQSRERDPQSWDLGALASLWEAKASSESTQAGVRLRGSQRGVEQQRGPDPVKLCQRQLAVLCRLRV